MGKAWAYWIGLGSTIEARATLDKMPATGDAQAVWMRFWQEIFESQPRAALRQLEGFPGEWLAFTESYSPKALLAGHAYRYLGDAAAARAAYDEARVMLEPEVAKFPDDPRRQSALGIAYAGLGRRTEAIQAGQRAVDLHPMSKDAFSGAYYASELAFIHAIVGEHDLAIDRLEELLAVPSLISVPIVRLDPRWATLANEPRFQALLRAGK
jgi:tetratricopeptide (TPR) repeat protein